MSPPRRPAEPRPAEAKQLGQRGAELVLIDAATEPETELGSGERA